MKALQSFETSEIVRSTTQCHISEEPNLNFQRHVKLLLYTCMKPGLSLPSKRNFVPAVI